MNHFVRLLLACLLPLGFAAESTAALRVSLLTCAPGREVYQLEGHTALRLIETPDSITQNDYDIVVNWGVFDFTTPNFVYRFVKGATDYMAVAYPTELFVEEYSREHRCVTEQVIDLSPMQAQRLKELVAENLRPENRTYRYNYVKDNCATRPLALIEAAAGTSIQLPDAPESTFRRDMTRYHGAYPWYQFGIDLALGSGIDHPITSREQTFAPVDLQQKLSSAVFIPSSAGETPRPVVSSTSILVDGAPEGTADKPTPWPLSPMGMAVMLLVVTALLSIRDIRAHSLSRWFDSVLYSAFFLAGCVLTFLIFVSEHEATSPNWLYLWLNPLCIIPAVGIWIKKCRRAVYCYQICNFAALTVLLAGSHFFGQAQNTAFPLLVLCDMMRSATYMYIYKKHSIHHILTNRP